MLLRRNANYRLNCFNSLSLLKKIPIDVLCGNGGFNGSFMKLINFVFLFLDMTSSKTRCTIQQFTLSVVHFNFSITCISILELNYNFNYIY